MKTILALVSPAQRQLLGLHLATINCLVSAGQEFTILHTLDGFRAILSQPANGDATKGDGATPEAAIEDLLTTVSNKRVVI